jgi:hypothetical protein
MDLILIPLQPNQPPARRTHAQQRHDTTEHHAQNCVPQPTTRNHHSQATGREHDEKNREGQMERPGVMLEVAAEDREQTEDFDAEEG